MPLFAGDILLADRTAAGWMEVEAGAIVAWGVDEPAPRSPDARGWIVPAPVNAHVHAADTFLRGVAGKPDSLGELVGPGGWKHRHLAAASGGQIAAGVETLAAESAAAGCAAMLDFREGGEQGVRHAKAARPATEVRHFGRPLAYGFDAEEARRVLAVADGIGLSAVRDFRKRADAAAWAEAAHQARKPLAIHASEAVHEEMDGVLALQPAFIVHACKASRADVEAAAGEGVAMVVCPRSNRRFGLKPPVPAMLDAGAMVALGTDNGMLQDGDIWKEVALLRAWFPDVALDAWLRMATHNGRRLAGLPAPALADGASADWVVLPPQALASAPRGKPSLAPLAADGGPLAPGNGIRRPGRTGRPGEADGATAGGGGP